MTSSAEPTVGGLDLPDGRAEVGALQRALTLLDVLFAAERALNLAEISERAGLRASTSHRLLAGLVQSGYVYRDAGKRYLPGGRMFSPLSVYHPLNGLRRSASPIIRDLRDSTGLTAVLVFYFGCDRVIIELLPGNDPFSLYYDTMLATPLHASTTGKLLLAYASPQDRDTLLKDEPYEARASRTITQRDRLDQELARVLAAGYAETRDEVFDGMAGVAAPILLAQNRLTGAVVLSGPTTHLTESRSQDVAQLLRRTAELFAQASPDFRNAVRFLGV